MYVRILEVLASTYLCLRDQMCVRIKTHPNRQYVCPCNTNKEYTVTFYFAVVVHNSIHVRHSIVYNSYIVSKFSFCWE